VSAAIAIANTAWLTASSLEWLRFKNSASCLEQTQRAILKSYLESNSDTEFGDAHGFARIRHWEDYSEKVPIRTYDKFKPFVDRISHGAQRVLTRQQVRLLEPSSGSTGPAKLIPFTSNLQLEFRRAVATWITSTFLDHPALLGGPAYWSLTPSITEPQQGKGEIPIGFAADSEYLGGISQSLIRRTLVAPGALRIVSDMKLFWHLTLLFVLARRDLRLISVWHPSFINLMLKYMQRNWGRLLRDLRDGLAASHPDLRISPDIRRARELSDLDPASPMEIWPQLELISCWADAHAASYVQDIVSEFPGVTVQAKGLVATEAFVTLPLNEMRPLAIRSHFFEFLDDAGQVRASWQLERGRCYTVIVTTGGGLYRYKLGDRVEIDGFWRQVPSMRFLGKSDSVTDYFGEKLSEPFVSKVLQSLFEVFDLQPKFAMLAFDDSTEQAAYVLYLSSESGIPSTLAARLDAGLRENPHYDLCIRLGQLGTTRIATVAPDSFQCYATRLVRHGMRLGDIKPVALSPLKNWQVYFQNVPLKP